MHAVERLLALALPLLAAAMLGACAVLPEPARKSPSHALPAQDTSLQRIAAASRVPHDPFHSGVRLLPNGDHALDARLALVQRAERSLDLQYYAWAGDDTGRQLLRALHEAAERGVRVRLLVDDLHAGAALPSLAALDAHVHAEVRLFNPLPAREGGVVARVIASLHEFGRINHRMHNKLFIADSALAVTGGRNIGDDYFMRSTTANFVDLDLLVAGPAVDDMATVFDRYWNSDRAWPVQRLAPRANGRDAGPGLDVDTAGATSPIDLDPLDRLGRSSVRSQLAAGRLELLSAPVRLLADAPEKDLCEEDAEDGACPSDADGVVASLFAAMRTTRAELKITSPYFVPGAQGMAVLQEVAGRGATLRLLTNSIGATDEPLVHWGYARYRTPLLEMGVHIRELSPTLPARTQAFGSFGRSAARLHAKVLVIDRRWVALGSANMDRRSARLNTEMALMIDSPALADELARLASAEALAGSYRLRLGDGGRVEWMVSDGDVERTETSEPHFGWGQRLRLGLVAMWIDEDQL